MTAASTDVLHGPGKLHPGCALSRTGRPYRKPRGERGGHADTAQWAKHWGDMPAAGPIYQRPNVNEFQTQRSAERRFPNHGAGWLINLARVPRAGGIKVQATLGLRGPHSQSCTCTRSAQCKYLVNPFSPSSPTDFDRPWQGARGAADRGQGGSQVPPLAPAGPRRADTRTGWLRDAVPVESDTFPVDFGREPRGVVVPSPEQYVPTELGVARLGHLTRGNSPSACPPRLAQDSCAPGVAQAFV